MKININLQPVNNEGSGIAKFANELINYLSYIRDYDIQGVFNYVRRVKPKDLSRFNFPIHYSYIPYKLIYSNYIKKTLPINYSCIAGRGANINLFFTYKIPRVHYSGITISTIHDIIPLKTEVESEMIRQTYLNDIKYTAQKSDYLITVSESSKNDIIETLDFDPNRIIIIPNGVNYSEFNKPITQNQIELTKIKYKLPHKFILYMGGMRKHKNIDNLIKAYSLLEEQIKEGYHLVITQGTPELYHLVTNLKQEKFIHFTPYVDEEDKIGIYQAASLFTFISSYEGFGIPVIEAQAAGTPVLTSATSSLLEIGYGSTLQVIPSDIDAITDKLKLILTNKTLQEDLIKKGMLNAQKYSWEAAGEKLKNFLNKV